VEQPTLEDLRGAASPAWLWDSARLRIVWANAAGLAFFDAETLFDLVDRPFDRREPGVARIVELGRNLQHGEAKPALLAFPSAGTVSPLACLCYAHALPDGRLGLLVTANAEPGDIAADLKAEGLDALPLAALIATLEGTTVYANPAATALLPAYRRTSLGELLGPDVADALLTRIGAAGTLGFVRKVVTRQGERDLKITARLGSGERIVLVLDDVTERRALERESIKPAEMAETPTPRQEPPPPAPPPREEPAEARLSPSEQAVFKEIGAELNHAAAKPKPAVPAIPPMLLATIEKLAGCNIFLKDGAVLYANAAALKLLRHASLESLIGSPTAIAIATNVAAREPIAVPLGDGTTARLRLTTDTMPWISGPALRVDLAVVETAELRIVPPAPPPPPPEPLPKPENGEASIVRGAFPRLATGPNLPSISQPEAPVETAPPPAAANDDTNELRAVLDTVADGIITLDEDGNIRRMSAGAEAIFGRHLVEVAGKPFASLLAQESRKVLRDYLAALKGPGLASVFNDGREVTAIERGGGRVPLFLTIGKLDPDRAGGARFSAVVRDITQWKKTEEELREARDKAEKASRQKSEFLAKVSHELRTPLNAILGFSEVMRLERFGEIRNDKYRGYVNDIYNSGSHLLSLIDDLLDLSKVEAGKLELNFTAVSLAEIADHAIKLVQDHAAQARVIIRKNVPPGLPKVVADLRSMRQIALNLLSNAIKYTDPGGQAIFSAELTPAGELVLRVKDSGIGMSEAEIQDALEPFRRISTGTRDAPGTGLGLPLTKALAEANRARFSITSEPRKGTTIEITFPVTRVLAE
jgi:PAS domain S-box-containing protein